MAWTDPTLDLTIKCRKIHIDVIISRLNTERSKRGYSTVSLSLTANQTKIVATHISDLRAWIDETPLTIGCSSYNSTVYSTNYSSEKNYNGSVYSTMNYSGICSSKYVSYNEYG